jgi:porin
MRAGVAASLLLVSSLLAEAASAAPASLPSEEKEPAVLVEASYTVDLWRNLDGGLKRGSRYLDNGSLTATVDGGALGWGGASVHAHILYNNGASLTDELVGDSQVVSNIDAGSRAVRLFEAWVEQKLGSGSLKVGLYDLNSEFDANDSAGLFLNSSHGIGPDFSQTGLNGPSIFPVTSLAVRADADLGRGFTARAALLDAVPGDPDRPKRTLVRLGRGEGALGVGELNLETGPARIGLGYWRYLARFDDLLASALAGEPVRARGNDGAYAFVEARLGSLAAGTGELKGWLRTGFADRRFNAIGRYTGGGLVLSDPFGPAGDALGVAAGWIEHARRARTAARVEGAELGPREIAVELTYRRPVAGWLTVQPDLQYVIHPGGNRSLGNALVLGLRMETSFTLLRR